MINLIDFDGTIVDVWSRYHAVFCAASGCSEHLLSRSMYRGFRLSGKTDIDIIKTINIVCNVNEFRRRKHSMLENPEMLSKDSLIICKERLLGWFAQDDCYILTVRRNPSVLFQQMSELGIGLLRPRTVIINPDSGTTKEQWAKQLPRRSDEILAIGDSCSDMEIGRLDNARAVHVQTGLFSWDYVHKQCPWAYQITSLQDYVDGLQLVGL